MKTETEHKKDYAELLHEDTRFAEFYRNAMNLREESQMPWALFAYKFLASAWVNGAYHAPNQWQDISTAPKDREIVVYAPSCHGLNHMVNHCQWHEDAGFCIDELRAPTLWTEMPNQ